MSRKFDVLIAGAGVVGCAVARELLRRRPLLKVAVLEKEPEPARHTSGRNSGVLHAGFNPKPGTLKAKYCVDGNHRLRVFCQEKKLPFSPVGTLVVALDQAEIPVLEELLRRGRANGVPDLRIIGRMELQQREPASTGVAALYAPTGGIASGKAVTFALADEARAAGARFFFSQPLQALEETDHGITAVTSSARFEADRFVNCAGLQADRVAHMLDVGSEFTIVPFRGEYFRVKPEAGIPLNSMLYPVPDLAFPFLGVHWTRTVAGDILLGPNAALAWGREAYKREVVWNDMKEMLGQGNFLKSIFHAEFRRVVREQFFLSMSQTLFVREARKLVPALQAKFVEPAKSGIRAQLVDKSGKLVDDIVVLPGPRSLHVLNAVSPGFTSSLPFADSLVDQLL